MRRSPVLAMLATVLGLFAVAATANAADCNDELKRSFHPDALTTVLLVKQFRAGDPLVIAEPVTAATLRAPSDLCLVKLNVGPGNPGPVGAPSTSPGIGIEVWLPDPARWNGRIHNTGGRGGFDGGTHGLTSEVGWPYTALTAGSEGAVSASTDAGHWPINGAWAMNPDGTPARNLWADFAYRAQHEVALKSKALTLRFYGRAAHHAYYEGVSTGGRHGYRLAQQFPNDYDGIVANLPALNWAEWVTEAVYRALVIERDLGGIELTEEQQDYVSNAAIAACDSLGGEHLGYVLDNAACHYDPVADPAVICLMFNGTSTSPNCLTPDQAVAVRKLWYGMTSDGTAPPRSEDNGVGVALTGQRRWFGLMAGTSLYNAFFKRIGYNVSTKSGYNADQVALELQNPTLAGPLFKNASGDGQGLWAELSYAQLSNAFDRGVALGPVFGSIASDNPNLSAFKARGGKFLSWHGWNDEAIPVQGTIRYYEAMSAAMGGVPAAQSFFKLYLIPGAGHMSPNGTSNEAAHPPIVDPGKFYEMLTDWVERGIEPGRMELENPPDSPVRIHQPACPYPQRAVYINGDPKVSASFECRT